jgi:hypothetical protein
VLPKAIVALRLAMQPGGDTDEKCARVVSLAINDGDDEWHAPAGAGRGKSVGRLRGTTLSKASCRIGNPHTQRIRKSGFRFTLFGSNTQEKISGRRLTRAFISRDYLVLLPIALALDDRRAACLL